jgi:hypothetical protein
VPGLVRAATVLFAQGLADPRGLGYRHVEIAATVDLDAAAAAVATRAWILPGAEEGPRFGIAWNGLVYPLLSRDPRLTRSAVTAAS